MLSCLSRFTGRCVYCSAQRTLLTMPRFPAIREKLNLLCVYFHRLLSSKNCPGQLLVFCSTECSLSNLEHCPFSWPQKSICLNSKMWEKSQTLCLYLRFITGVESNFCRKRIHTKLPMNSNAFTDGTFARRRNAFANLIFTVRGKAQSFQHIIQMQ